MVLNVKLFSNKLNKFVLDCYENVNFITTSLDLNMKVKKKSHNCLSLFLLIFFLTKYILLYSPLSNFEILILPIWDVYIFSFCFMLWEISPPLFSRMPNEFVVFTNISVISKKSLLFIVLFSWYPLLALGLCYFFNFCCFLTSFFISVYLFVLQSFNYFGFRRNRLIYQCYYLMLGCPCLAFLAGSVLFAASILCR